MGEDLRQVGRIDAGLLERVDERARQLGQTRRIYVERSLRAVLAAESDQEESWRERASA
jgi:hypothetical protein